MFLNDRLGILAVVAAVAVCATAGAQVRYVPGGRALDSNYSLTGGRVNSRVSSYGGFNSQLYVTGQVTGLGAFRGPVGYSAADQLRLNLPTSTVSDFIRRSVGPSQAYGDSYQTSPYYDRAGTVFGVRRIVAGDTVPGCNMPADRRLSAQPTVDPETVSGLYQDAVSRYRGVEPLDPFEAARGIPLVRGDRRRERSVMWSGERDRYTLWPTGEDDARSRRGRDDPEAGQDLPRSGYEDSRVSSLLDARLETALRNAVESKVPDRPDYVEPAEGEKERDGTADARPRIPETIEPDQDVYLDILRRLREAREADRPARPDESDPPADPKAGDPDAGPEPFARVTRRGERVVLHGLAGRSPDIFNRRLAAAESRLRSGRYYDAAGAYDLAAEMRPANPLPHLGSTLSLVGAGEPYAAGLRLYRAMRLFPPLMEVDVDPSLLDGEVLSRRLAALDRRLGESGDEAPAMLVFLATYMHAHWGRPEQAEAYARRLMGRAMVKQDKLLEAFASHVLQSGRPMEAPEAAAPEEPGAQG